MARRLSAVEFCKGRGSELQTIRRGKYFNRDADNLRGRNNFDDFAHGNKSLASVDNGGFAVRFWRHFKGNGGGGSRRQVEKNFGRTMTLDIAKKIIAGERLKPSDDLNFLLTMPLEKLQVGAHLIQKNFFGNRIDLCTIINGKSGRCSENCKYCAQSARHKTGIDEYDFLPSEKILEVALANEKAGVNRFSIVTSGRALDDKNFERAIETYKILCDKLRIGVHK